MTTQTEAQRLADDIHSAVPTYKLCQEAADELRRLAQVETAWREWLDKTEWVQTSSNAGELGMHRADVLRQRIENLEAENARMRSERQTLQAEGKHPAPCARFCEANAFQIEIRGLKAENTRLRSELERPMSSEATVLVHDNARLRKELEALRGAVPDERDNRHASGETWARAQGWNECVRYMRGSAPQPEQGEKQ